MRDWCCRDALAHLGIAYQYVSCIEFDKPRPLLQAIIGQLKVPTAPPPGASGDSACSGVPVLPAGKQRSTNALSSRQLACSTLWVKWGQGRKLDCVDIQEDVLP